MLPVEAARAQERALKEEKAADRSAAFGFQLRS
jgi:hypothetical protein